MNTSNQASLCKCNNICIKNMVCPLRTLAQTVSANYKLRHCEQSEAIYFFVPYGNCIDYPNKSGNDEEGKHKTHVRA